MFHVCWQRQALVPEESDVCLKTYVGGRGMLCFCMIQEEWEKPLSSEHYFLLKRDECYFWNAAVSDPTTPSPSPLQSLPSAVAVSYCAGPGAQPGASQIHLPPFCLNKPTSNSPQAERKPSVLPWFFFFFLPPSIKCSSNDITLLQCCTVHERCQSFPVKRLSAWLCFPALQTSSWRDGVDSSMPCSYYYAGGRLHEGGRGRRMFFFLLRDTQQDPHRLLLLITSRPGEIDPRSAVLGRWTKSCMKTNCSHDCA